LAAGLSVPITESNNVRRSIFSKKPPMDPFDFFVRNKNHRNFAFNLQRFIVAANFLAEFKEGFFLSLVFKALQTEDHGV
jgi:hypothetical protein